MTRPSDPARYPLQFAELFQRLHATGQPIPIPSENPLRLRSLLYGYMQALRKAGQSELADGVTLSLSPLKPAKGEAGTVTLLLRDTSPVAQEVAAALSALPPT